MQIYREKSSTQIHNKIHLYTDTTDKNKSSYGEITIVIDIAVDI